MTRRLANPSVTVDLGAGSFAVSWPETGVTAGPFTAGHEWGGDARAPAAGRTSWKVEPRDVAGRAGALARWDSGGGSWISVHVPVEGPVVTVESGDVAVAGERFARAVVLEGPVRLCGGDDSLGRATRLVEGYEGCSYAGVQPAAKAGASWWRAAFVAPDGPVFAVQALTAQRFATVVESRGEDGGGIALRVAQGATPAMVHVSGTIGHVVKPPDPLDLEVAPGMEVRTEPFLLAAGHDAVALVEDLAALAGEAMGARRRAGPPVSGWESWYYYGLLDVSAENVLANARIMRERYGDRPGFDLVQIDDGWQRTYGGWWPNERFPSDMGEITAALRDVGCRPGLWLAPFMVQPGAPGLGTDHVEWAIGDGEGVPLLDRHDRWGVDATHPDALAWLHDLGAQVKSWGFDMVKLDFLHLGAMDGARHDPGVTGIEAMRRGMGAFLDGLGRDAYVLACMVPMLAVVGRCDAVRSGNDLATPVRLRAMGDAPPVPAWTGYSGILPQGRNTAARWALSGRWFDLGPDVVMAWGSDGADPAGYSTEEARAQATLAVMAGGPFLLADHLAALSPGERAVIEHPALLDLLTGGGFRPLDLFARPDGAEVEHVFAQAPDTSSVWVAERGGARVAALWNWTDHAAMRALPSGFEGGREVWTGVLVRDGPLEVPAHGVRLVVR